MRSPKIVNPGKASNGPCKLSGAAILVANKIRHAIMGYRTPRPFGSEEIDRAVEYDFSVVDGLLDCLSDYCRGATDLSGKRVLELGPGADMGVGLILLATGAGGYTAFDVHNLADTAGSEFYDRLLEQLSDRADADELRSQLALLKDGAPDRLCYRCERNFDMSVLPEQSVDLIVSQAAFEHFDDPRRTIEQMSALAAPGAMLVCEIDLATHTRWIRDRDPLNIYRYGDGFYNAMKFRGSPNRVRPREYKKMLADAGWEDVRQVPLAVLDEERLAEVQPALARRFREDADMRCLSIAICARI